MEQITELMWKVEALLFASGDKISIEEISKLLKSDEKSIKKACQDLQHIYKERETALVIFEENNAWKLHVKEKYLNLVRKIIVRTELSKTVMETLAVLAWKAPMKQSELIDIRTNKAYDHINELEELGFINKEKYGRTYMLKLTQKFLDYFELEGKQDIEKKFGKFKDVVPQKQVSDFEERTQEEIEQEKQAQREAQMLQLDETKKAFEQKVMEQKQQDQNFLKDVESRINQVAQEHSKTSSEIEAFKKKQETQDLPSQEEQSDEQHQEDKKTREE